MILDWIGPSIYTESSFFNTKLAACIGVAIFLVISGSSMECLVQWRGAVSGSRGSLLWWNCLSCCYAWNRKSSRKENFVCIRKTCNKFLDKL